MKIINLGWPWRWRSVLQQGGCRASFLATAKLSCSVRRQCHVASTAGGNGNLVEREKDVSGLQSVALNIALLLILPPKMSENVASQRYKSTHQSDMLICGCWLVMQKRCQRVSMRERERLVRGQWRSQKFQLRRDSSPFLSFSSPFSPPPFPFFF